MTVDENNEEHFFSIGKEETNNKHLGCTTTEAAESIFHEIETLKDFKIVDFAAASKYSQIIIGGEENVEDGLYEHELPDKTKAKGLLHFYKEGGAWKFLSEADYDLSKKANTLPAVCFATKCGIKNISKVLETLELFKDSEETFKDMLVAETDAKHTEVSSLSKQEITGARYYAVSKINSSEQRVNLSEEEIFRGSNVFDANPFLYYRFSRPLKEGVKIPATDLKLIHGETSKFGFSIEVIPDSSFIQNDKLIELTKEAFNEQTKSIEKYPTGQDKDLIMEMNRLFKDASKEIKDVEVEKDLKVGDMKFKNEKIKKLSDTVKKARVKLLWGFNKMFVSMNSYLVSEPVKPFKGMKA